MKKTLSTLLVAALAAPAALLATRAQADAAAPPPAVHQVRMVMEGTTARFEPASLTIRAGDQVRFTTASGGPHNVAFDAGKVTGAAAAALTAGMPNVIAPLSGPFVINAGDSYTVSFAGVPAGRYDISCLPHVAMGMKGVITVQ